jgi:hypothetical protein
MAPDHPHQRTQEQSIKARKHQLYEDDEPIRTAGPRKSFQDCLRERPADPLSPLVKGILWVVGSVVILLLVAALATGGGKKKARPRTADASTPTVESTVGKPNPSSARTFPHLSG